MGGIILQRRQPRIDIGGVIGAGVMGNPKIGKNKAADEFGTHFLGGVFC